MESKKEIRKRILAQRNALSDTQRFRSQMLLTDRILEHEWYKQAEAVLLYAAYGSEISTDAVLEDALRTGKKVYLPKVEDCFMEFYRILKTNELKPGYKGILEPDGRSEKFIWQEGVADGIQTSLSALMLMPGVAFDISGNRIGYGKGFYDRYLADKASLPTIAIGFACQMTEHITADETDRKPMQVICL